MGRAAEFVKSWVLGVGVDAVAGDDGSGRVSASTPLGLGSSGGSLRSYTVSYAEPSCTARVTRTQAMAIPTIKRGRDVICSTVASLPFTFWRATPVDVDDEQIEPAVWATRPDPARTRAHLISWTVDDLIFEAAAYWEIVERTTAELPAKFRRLPTAEVTVDPSGDYLRHANRAVAAADVVQFLSLTDSLLQAGARHITIADKLDRAAERFADVEIPSGYLKYDGDEDVDQDDLNDLADMWSQRRRANATAALPKGLDFSESTSDPQRLQLTEARQHQALELCRLVGTPPWTAGAPTGTGMTYQNAQQARLDALDFGALPFITTIEETLSGPMVSPLGTYVRLDTRAWLDVESPALTVPTAQPEEAQP